MKRASQALDAKEKLPEIPRAYSANFLRRGSARRYNPLSFHIPFLTHRKGTAFIYPLLTNSTPLTYLPENFTFVLTDSNALAIKI